MSQQVFRHPIANTIAKLLILGAVGGAVGLTVFSMLVARSPLMAQVDIAPVQPVPFSHQHHVDGLGLVCRYCHVYVEDSPNAGVPQTEVCVGCHSQVWADSPTLAPVLDSYKANESLQWQRVYDLPDYVYFNHSIHIKKGVACVSCHGQVNEMPIVRKESTLHMDWCLDCHRHREDNIRPRSEVFNMHWEPPEDLEALQRQLVEDYHVDVEQFNITDCSVCHR